MGTNYYHINDVTGERKHIGKSSVGWVFLIRVYEDEDIHTLDDWQQRWHQPNTHIENEYGERRTPDQMLHWITGRAFPHAPTPQSLAENMADAGPNNLMRPRMGARSGCVGHGRGTWSYINTDFT